MNTTLMRTFLTVIATRNITQAAGQLYVSQSTVSERIRQLEEELGQPLFVRQRGIRSLRLTPQGDAFVRIAQRYMDLNREIDSFKAGENAFMLTVACSDSLNTCLFAPFYRRLLQEESNLRLNIRTHQSHEIYRLVEEHAADVGFIFYLSRHKDVVAEKVFSEKMVFALSPRIAKEVTVVSPAELDPSHEIRCSWSDAITAWHDSRWNPDLLPAVQMNTVSTVANYLSDPKSWLLCPLSVARSLRNECGALIADCTDEIPTRDAYLITLTSLHDAERIRFFREKLRSYLQEVAPSFTSLGNKD